DRAGGRVAAAPTGRIERVGLEPLDHDQGGEAGADAVGEVGGPGGILGHVGLLAATLAVEGLLRELHEGIKSGGSGISTAHGRFPRIRLAVVCGSQGPSLLPACPALQSDPEVRNSGRFSNKDWSRVRARTYRLLAPAFVRPRTAAASPLVSSSKCRSAMISRSIGSRASSACWSR